MNNPFVGFRHFCLFSGLAVALASAPVAASTPDQLADLLYQDYGWGSDQLRMRGYTIIKSDYHRGKTVEYWWNPTTSTCIRVHADDKTTKYDAISTASSTDCNQYHKEVSKNDKAAAIAIGAAALIGAAVLAHQSHHRDGKHDQDEKSVAEFDRGYRDGLHHERYHNYNDTAAYSDGYDAGQRQRDEQLRHHRSDSTLPPPHVAINREDDAATVTFRGGCEVLFAPSGEMTKWSSYCTDQEKKAAGRAYAAARSEKKADLEAYRDI